MVGKNFWKQVAKEPSYVPGHPSKVLIPDEQVKMLLDNVDYCGQGCLMLADNLCLIHKLLGYEYKPEKCKRYFCEK